MAAYKLETQLQHFRYNSIENKGALHIDWFIYDEDNEDNETRGFTNEELKQFESYTVANPENFPGTKNYHLISEGEEPSCDIYNMIPDDKLKFPKNLIIKSQPELSPQITACMEIMLLRANGSENHTYNLPFAVVGKIRH